MSSDILFDTPPLLTSGDLAKGERPVFFGETGLIRPASVLGPMLKQSWRSGDIDFSALFGTEMGAEVESRVIGLLTQAGETHMKSVVFPHKTDKTVQFPCDDYYMGAAEIDLPTNEEFDNRTLTIAVSGVGNSSLLPDRVWTDADLPYDGEIPAITIMLEEDNSRNKNIARETDGHRRWSVEMRRGGSVRVHSFSLDDTYPTQDLAGITEEEIGFLLEYVLPGQHLMEGMRVSKKQRQNAGFVLDSLWDPRRSGLPPNQIMHTIILPESFLATHLDTERQALCVNLPIRSMMPIDDAVAEKYEPEHPDESLELLIEALPGAVERVYVIKNNQPAAVFAHSEIFRRALGHRENFSDLQALFMKLSDLGFDESALEFMTSAAFGHGLKGKRETINEHSMADVLDFNQFYSGTPVSGADTPVLEDVTKTYEAFYNTAYGLAEQCKAEGVYTSDELGLLLEE